MSQMSMNFDEEEVVEDTNEPQVFSVSELNRQIKKILEGEFPLIWLQAEISNFKAHTSGHFYFSLKDDKAQINAVMFRGHNSRLKFRPESGLEVLVRGRVTVYEPRGNYQVFVESMEPLGAGALQLAYEQLKKKLKAEGLFDEKKKKSLPSYPKHIAVVTSPTGAAIRDILNVLRRRHAGARVTVIPAQVQGETAARTIVKGIEAANSINDVDVMIVGRGGGSIEDLWCFNEESVARAIAASEVPVISAVGHEVDFTIADFVADLRAPTPSAAAELVVKNTTELIEKIKTSELRLVRAMRSEIESLKTHIYSLKRSLIDPRRRLQDLALRSDELLQRLHLATMSRLRSQRHQIEILRGRFVHPQDKIKELRQRMRLSLTRIDGATKRGLERRELQLKRLMEVMDSLSPLKVVERGYSIVTKAKKVVKDYGQIKKGDSVHLRFAKGQATAKIEEVSDGL